MTVLSALDGRDARNRPLTLPSPLGEGERGRPSFSVSASRPISRIRSADSSCAPSGDPRTMTSGLERAVRIQVRAAPGPYLDVDRNDDLMAPFKWDGCND